MYPWDMQDQSKFWNFRSMDPRRAPERLPPGRATPKLSPALTEEEKLRRALALARSQGTNPALGGPPISPQSYGLQASSGAEGPAQNTFLPGEQSQIMDSGMNDGQREAMDRQYAQAEALRNSQLPTPGRIQMSSGTSYTPAPSKEAVLANILAQAVGQYKMNKTEKKREEMDRKEREAAKIWTERVLRGPMTPTEEKIRTQNARDFESMPAPNYDLGKSTVWDKLRRYF